MRLDRIRTGGGDGGFTALSSGVRVPKTDPLVEALGAVDELNSALGLVGASLKGELRAQVRSVQNDLFDAGADLSAPRRRRGRAALLSASHIARVERTLDRLNRTLKPLASFVLPGGNSAAALSHLARAVCRRAERRVWALGRRRAVNPEVGKYLNRLSDYLFVLARTLGKRRGGDTLWVPGASRARRR